LKTEVIFKEDLELIFGKRPFQKNTEKVILNGSIKPEKKVVKKKVAKKKKASTPKKSEKS